MQVKPILKKQVPPFPKWHVCHDNVHRASSQWQIADIPLNSVYGQAPGQFAVRTKERCFNIFLREILKRFFFRKTLIKVKNATKILIDIDNINNQNFKSRMQKV